MLKKTFTLASAVSLAGIAMGLSASTACGGSEDSNPTPDAGGSSSSSSSSSGDNGSSSSSSSSSSSGGTSGNPVLAKDPATVQGATVQFGKCEAFTKCDGAVKGQWKVTGGCLSDDTFDQFKQFCAGVTVHDVTIKVSGTVGIDDTNVTRDTTFFVHAPLDIDKNNCAALALAGGCAGVGTLLKSGNGGSKFDDAACNDAGDKCLCAAQTTITEKTTDPETYALDGNGTLTTTTKGNERTFDYCPKGGNITYRETTEKNATFGMFIQIGPK